MSDESSCRFLVTGGSGPIGFHIGLRLLQLKHEVILFDINYPSEKWDSNIRFSSEGNSGEIEEMTCSFGKMKFVKGDVRDINILMKITHNVTCVIHTVGYGMSGEQQIPRYFSMMEEINVHGTRNVIEACAHNHVRGLVYTSTTNVIFGGDAILNGDESLPYFPLHRHVDHYSRTKAIAEQLVLTSNGRGDLQTCALRLTGVMGPGDTRILPRATWAIKNGFLMFNIADQHGALIDWIGRDNAVQGHVKAALKLANLDRKNPKIGGQAFFLSDGRPIFGIDYLKPIYQHYGQPLPTVTVPLWIARFFVLLFMWIQSLLFAFSIDFVPVCNHSEFQNSFITHYFSIDKARKYLDYEPVKPNDLSDVIDSLAKNEVQYNVHY